MDSAEFSVPDVDNPDADRRLALPVARLRDSIAGMAGAPPGADDLEALRDAAEELVRLARQRSTTTHRRQSSHEGHNVVASLRMAAQALQRRRPQLGPDHRETLVEILGKGIGRIHELGRAEVGVPTFERGGLERAVAQARPEVALVSARDIPDEAVIFGDLRDVRDVLRALRRAIGAAPVIHVIGGPGPVGLRVGASGGTGRPPRWTVELPPAYPEDMTVTVDGWPPDVAGGAPDVRATVWLPVVRTGSARD